MLNDIQKKILQEVADMTGIPDGAVNIRSDGQKEYRQNSEHITGRTGYPEPEVEESIRY